MSKNIIDFNEAIKKLKTAKDVQDFVKEITKDLMKNA